MRAGQRVQAPAPGRLQAGLVTISLIARRARATGQGRALRACAARRGRGEARAPERAGVIGFAPAVVPPRPLQAAGKYLTGAYILGVGRSSARTAGREAERTGRRLKPARRAREVERRRRHAAPLTCAAGLRGPTGCVVSCSGCGIVAIGAAREIPCVVAAERLAGSHRARIARLRDLSGVADGRGPSAISTRGEPAPALPADDPRHTQDIAPSSTAVCAI